MNKDPSELSATELIAQVVAKAETAERHAKHWEAQFNHQKKKRDELVAEIAALREGKPSDHEATAKRIIDHIWEKVTDSVWGQMDDSGEGYGVTKEHCVYWLVQAIETHGKPSQ